MATEVTDCSSGTIDLLQIHRLFCIQFNLCHCLFQLLLWYSSLMKNTATKLGGAKLLVSHSVT